MAAPEEKRGEKKRRKEETKEEEKDVTLRTLVLGMAFVTEEEAKKMDKHAIKGTSAAASRDRARLLALSALRHPSYDIISMNWGQSDKVCEPYPGVTGKHRHFQGYFSGRAARAMHSVRLSDRPFDRVFTDYFRFPSAYLKQAYGTLIQGMLRAMLQLGLITYETQIYLPHVPWMVKELQMYSNIAFRAIPAKEYPLYSATEQTPADLLGGYVNSEQITALTPHCPFLVMQFTGNAT